MSDRTTRRRLVDLSIVSVSAAVFAGGWLAVTRVERQKERAEATRPPAVEAPVDPPVAPRAASSAQQRETTPRPLEPAPRRRSATRPAPPVRYVRPAPRPPRRIIIRRTRAS